MRKAGKPQLRAELLLIWFAAAPVSAEFELSAAATGSV
jgi:hypothetical protein